MSNLDERALELVAGAGRVEVFTGAGMSADSGIATYRDAQTGVWENVDPQAMASIDAWARDPEPMWAWYLWRRTLVARAEPNAGHRALADWEGAHITTQNIDDLHERAGSGRVTHLHGSLFEFRCSICARPWRGEIPTLAEPVERLAPPLCPLCGNLVRPGVVWFGEPLPAREWQVAEEAMRDADLVVIVGTSGVVQPAASLPLIAHELGTPIIEVSPQPTELTRFAEAFCQGAAAEVLPALVDAATRP